MLPRGERPALGARKPLTASWPAGRTLVRVHDSRYGATEPNPGVGDARFSPLRVPEAGVVATLYAAATMTGALSETVLHTVPTPGGDRRPRRVRLAALTAWVRSSLRCRRDLLLVRLDAAGCERLGTDVAALVTSPASTYPQTRRWASAVAAAAPSCDGLVWPSRQAPRTEALMLWWQTPGRAGGVSRDDLLVDAPPVPLLSPAGRDELLALAAELDITIVLP